MLFEVHTIYDPDTIRELKATISGGGRPGRQKSTRRGVLIAGVICLAAAAVLSFVLHNDLMGMLLLVCGIILLCIGASLDGYVDRRRQKEEKKGEQRGRRRASPPLRSTPSQSETTRGRRAIPIRPARSCWKTTVTLF